MLLWIFNFKLWDAKQSSETGWLDIVFVLDVSKSMNVLDYKQGNNVYSRLDTAKSLISNYISKNPQNRYWLVIFAWDAISTLPLTTDADIFLTLLKNVDYKNLSVQGSDFEKAINLWVNRFTDDKRSKVMIIMSDGWDDKIELNQIKSYIKDKNITSFVFWLWTDNGGYIPTWQDVFWNISYQKYNWDYVVSKLNQDNLESIANAMSGKYFNTNSIDKINSFLINLNKNIIKQAMNNADWFDISRQIAALSFFFFFLYIVYPFKKFRNILWN